MKSSYNLQWDIEIPGWWPATSLTLWREGDFLALVGHPSTNGANLPILVVVKILVGQNQK